MVFVRRLCCSDFNAVKLLIKFPSDIVSHNMFSSHNIMLIVLTRCLRPALCNSAVKTGEEKRKTELISACGIHLNQRVYSAEHNSNSFASYCSLIVFRRSILHWGIRFWTTCVQVCLHSLTSLTFISALSELPRHLTMHTVWCPAVWNLLHLQLCRVLLLYLFITLQGNTTFASQVRLSVWRSMLIILESPTSVPRRLFYLPITA